MPLTNAEKQKLYRERLKVKLGERSVLDKDAARKKAARSKDVSKSREAERERQQKCRAKKAAKLVVCTSAVSLEASQQPF